MPGHIAPVRRRPGSGLFNPAAIARQRAEVLQAGRAIYTATLNPAQRVQPGLLAASMEAALRQFPLLLLTPLLQFCLCACSGQTLFPEPPARSASFQRQPPADAPLVEVSDRLTAGHAKAFVVDGQKIYVGSFNLDHRSIGLNTELGLMIESPQLAGAVAGNFIDNVRNNAYRLELRSGGMVWHRADGRTFTCDPGASWLQRVGSRLSNWLPIEHLL